MNWVSRSISNVFFCWYFLQYLAARVKRNKLCQTAWSKQRRWYHICFAGLGKNQDAVEQFHGSMAKGARKCLNVDTSSCKWTFCNWRLTLLRQTVADLPLYVVVFMYACPFQHALLQAESHAFVLSFWRKNYVTQSEEKIM